MNETFIKKLFRNEITWIFSIIGMGWVIVQNIILPLQRVQLQLTQIQTDLGEVRKYDARITKNSDDIIRLQEQITKKK